MEGEGMCFLCFGFNCCWWMKRGLRVCVWLGGGWWWYEDIFLVCGCLDICFCMVGRGFVRGRIWGE